MTHHHKVTLDQLKAAMHCAWMAATVSEQRRNEIDFYCPKETRFVADAAELLQRFLHQIEQVAPDGVATDDLFLEFDDRERDTFTEILHIEIETTSDMIENDSDARNCSGTLRMLSHQLDLWDILHGVTQ